MKRICTLLVLFLFGITSLSALEQIRVSTTTTPFSGKDVYVDILSSAGTSLGIARITKTSLSSDAAGVLSFVINESTWTGLVYADVKNYIVKITLHRGTGDDVIIGLQRLEDLINKQGLFGALISPEDIDPNGNFTFNSVTIKTGDIDLNDADGLNKITLKAPEVLPADLSIVFPTGNGSSGQVLTTDGTGILSWTTAGSGLYWSLTGNGGTTPSTNFIGTTDDKDLIFKRNNQLSGIINNDKGLTSFGYQALMNNLTGDHNTAFGFSALQSNIHGSRNTAAGAFSLLVNDEISNSAFGFAALANNTSGGYNVAVGAYAGRTLSSGSSYNITGSSSVYLGYSTMASADGNSNEIAIGFGAVGNGTNSVTLGNTDIATTVLRGNVHFADGAAPYTSYIGIKSPNSPTTYNLILPPAQGGSDTYLKNDGAGNLSWAIAGSGLYWSLAGNGGTDSTINFIGTTDNNALMFKINNQTSGKISKASNTSLGYLTLNNPAITGVANTALGYMALSNTIGSSNTGLGAFALLNNTGHSNTAVGAGALRDNTSGGGNIAIGVQTLYHNDIGLDNIAIGMLSLENNTGGGGNIAIGSEAAVANTLGNSNIAFGLYALHSNTIGNNNTAIGMNSLYSNVANSRSTALGFNAMYYADDRVIGQNTYNTAVGYEAIRGSVIAGDNTGQYNTAIGDQALMNNTSGSRNTATGYQSLRVNSSGGDNTAYGLWAMQNNTIGNRNTAIGLGALMNNIADCNTATGYGALSYINTGTYNVALGAFAGRMVGSISSINNETSSYSVYIGASNNAGADGNTNEIVIGAMAIGAGSNTVTLGNTNIISTMLRGNVLFTDPTFPNSTHVGISAASGTTNYNLILPSAQGGANTYLKNDGSGNLSWEAGGGGGGGTIIQSTFTGLDINLTSSPYHMRITKTVTGAQIGDAVVVNLVGVTDDDAGSFVNIRGWVSAADTVTVLASDGSGLFNNTGLTLIITVIRP